MVSIHSALHGKSGLVIVIALRTPEEDRSLFQQSLQLLIGFDNVIAALFQSMEKGILTEGNGPSSIGRRILCF